MTINCKPETVNLDQKLLNYFQNLKTEAIIFKITSKLQKNLFLKKYLLELENQLNYICNNEKSLAKE